MSESEREYYIEEKITKIKRVRGREGERKRERCVNGRRESSHAAATMTTTPK